MRNDPEANRTPDLRFRNAETVEEAGVSRGNARQIESESPRLLHKEHTREIRDVPADSALRRKLAERLAARSIYEPTTGCLLWLGAIRSPPRAYGHVRVGYADMPVHRVAYELEVGPIPDGLFLDHKCRQPACLNVRHLEPVTNSENLQRAPGALRNRKHCAHGHELAAVGVLVERDRNRTYQRCAKCRESRQARRGAA